MTANELMISLGHLVATFGDKEIYIEDLPEMDIFGVDFDTGRERNYVIQTVSRAEVEGVENDLRKGVN